MRAELISKIGRAARRKDQNNVCDLIVNAGELSRAELGAALNGFLITKSNINKHPEAARKIASYSIEGGFIDILRFRYLESEIKEIEEASQ